MDNLLSKISNYNHVFVFGYGNVGQHIYEQLIDDKTAAIVRFCDNYKHGKMHSDTEVLTPDDAFKEYPDALFIIGSIIYHTPMLAQLAKMGVPDDNVVAQWIETKSRMKTRQFIYNLPYHLVEHCNLKCAGCLHFSNVAEESFADYIEFKESFGRFINVMGDAYRGGIEFFGGEPLLHPKIEQFLVAARELLADKSICIITNGISLTKMPDSFWNTCARNKVNIFVSGYPVNFDISAAKQLAAKNKVHLSTLSRGDGAWSQYVLDLDGTQDIKKSFSRCENANERFILKGGKIYNCSVTACIEHFNKAFGQSLQLKDEDYLDIHSDITAQEVLEFISTPTQFCRYCNREKLKLGQTWRLSKKTINEYLE
jgi:organic radical activating enzyme